MTTVLLIRHGLTDAVAGATLAGTRPGISLNTEGRRQAEALAARLREVPLAAIVSSPLERAMQTAAPIADEHSLSIRPVTELIEFEVGDWTGKTFAELDRDPEWRRFNDVRSLTAAPAGELMLDVQARAVHALLDLAVRHPDATVAAVSHGDVIRAALMHFLGIPLDFVHRLEIAPASVSIVEIDRGYPRIRLTNGDSAAGRL
jgi:probable phosphomutase (TIGR03848 family)